ncbi:agamous-like MADS-box protein AGL80 [Aegilops tauschii subsp. strangulata]|uniref:agamous-like MADS-box protein AGL80 n=1 Tax=Aegilops tauschii subsp. strangulata TaxID=200361 RepID=UPI000989CADD|nr:agamous-like MADS-box protein AGL80 [Aegilops tauschii subsp. strangulata]XP_044335531.1 agamous-like MADS-box protein AGL80 [Triticum aestivum]
MAHKKVALRYIHNRSTRRVTFKKRRNSMMKKAGELGTMCNTKACVLVYGEGSSVPHVFPSHADAVAILNRYKDMPDLVQFKNTVSQEEFLIERITKLQEEANRFRREREDREIRILLHKAMLGGSLDVHELTLVGPKLEVILKNLGERIAISQNLEPTGLPTTSSIGHQRHRDGASDDVSSASTAVSELA